MKIRIGLALVAVSMLLGGCATVAPQVAVPFAKVSTTGRIGVIMTKLPKVDTYFPGADCLLCMAAASIANANLTKHTQTLPYEDLPQLKDEVVKALKKNGAKNVTLIVEEFSADSLPASSSTTPNAARKDFTALKQTYNVDKLLVIDITMLGVIRTYSAYVPTSDPKAVLAGTGYMVNLNDNVYEWYLPVNVTKSADKAWDEAPKFPGLTNAYFQVVELGKDSFVKPLNTK
jgi:hypothetical protein